MKQAKEIALLLTILIGLSACSFSSKDQGRVFVGNQRTYVAGSCYEKYFTDYGNQLLNETSNTNEVAIYQDGISEILVFNPNKGITINVNKSKASKIYLESDPATEQSSFYLARSYNQSYPKKAEKHLDNPPSIYLDDKELGTVRINVSKDLVREPYLLKSENEEDN